MGCGRSEVSWLGAPRHAFPGTASPQWLHATHRHPFTVAGPRRFHTGLPSTTGRMNGCILPRLMGKRERHRYNRPPDTPPSSRGLGRRPLTAETGVRIPVAVLREPRSGVGFRRFRARHSVRHLQAFHRIGERPPYDEFAFPSVESMPRRAAARSAARNALRIDVRFLESVRAMGPLRISWRYSMHQSSCPSASSAACRYRSASC
jgi:hypothetical protein